MRNIYLIFCFVCLFSCALYSENLEPLGQLYSSLHGKPEKWPKILKQIKKTVYEILRTEEYEPDIKDVIHVDAFLYNSSSLESFVKSEYFTKEHVSCLLGLFKLSHRIASCYLNTSRELDEYGRILDNLKTKNFKATIRDEHFKFLKKCVEEILEKNIEKTRNSENIDI